MNDEDIEEFKKETDELREKILRLLDDNEERVVINSLFQAYLSVLRHVCLTNIKPGYTEPFLDEQIKFLMEGIWMIKKNVKEHKPANKEG